MYGKRNPPYPSAPVSSKYDFMFNVYPPFLTAMLTDVSISVGDVMLKYWVVYNCNNRVNSGAGNNLLWVSLKILSLSVLWPHTDNGWNLGFTTCKWQRSHCLLQYSQNFTNWVPEVVMPLKGWLLWSVIGRPAAILLQAFSSQLMNWKQHLLSGSDKRHWLRSAVSGCKKQQHSWSETKSDRPSFNIQAWLKVLHSGRISIKFGLKQIAVQQH